MHSHSITIINIATDLGQLAEILGDRSVQTIPLPYD